MQLGVMALFSCLRFSECRPPHVTEKTTTIRKSVAKRRAASSAPSAMLGMMAPARSQSATTSGTPQIPRSVWRATTIANECASPMAEVTPAGAERATTVAAVGRATAAAVALDARRLDAIPG